MKLRQLLRLTLAIVAFCLLAGPAKADPASQPQDEEAIGKVITAFSDAFAKLDAHAFAQGFHPDADFTNVFGMSAHGRAAIEAFHRPLLEGDGSGPVPSFKNAVFKVLDTHIRFLRPDVASVDVHWSQTGAIFHGKDMGPRKGLLMLTMTKEAGAWGIMVMHNMDLPMPPPPAQ